VSKALHLDEIAYCADSCMVFEQLRDLPGAALLESSFPHSLAGRYDILTALPQDSGLSPPAADADRAGAEAWFVELERFHREHYHGIQPASQDIPFCGGLLGYLPYELGCGLNRVHSDREPGQGWAAGGLRAYDWAVVQDHLLKRAVLVALPWVGTRQRADLLRRLQRPRSANAAPFALRGNFEANMSRDAYRAAFERIQSYIHAGDCYQVNLAQCFTAPCSGDPWSAYRALRVAAAAPFSAYLDFGGDDAVISLSPERFISVHGKHVETAPIKGTRPRLKDQRADRLAARELRNSDKDRAENLMIVDLLRNDLGRNCVPGSIHVDRLFEVQSFPTVHHLVSTISGELAPDSHALALLRDSFPGGSITGAPKRRAMQVIAELEPDPRQVYCGSVLYVSADGRMDSNIAIRTLLSRGGQIHCWAGGGIVADSRWELEYQETLDKVGRFLSLLEALPRMD
jgi:para-aminobenzoate synthetase component 1